MEYCRDEINTASDAADLAHDAVNLLGAYLEVCEERELLVAVAEAGEAMAEALNPQIEVDVHELMRWRGMFRSRYVAWRARTK